MNKKNAPFIIGGIIIIILVVIFLVVPNLNKTGLVAQDDSSMVVEDDVATTTPTPTVVSLTATDIPVPATEIAVETEVPTTETEIVVEVVEAEVLDDDYVWGPINAVNFADQPIPMSLVRDLVEDASSVSQMLQFINVNTIGIGYEWGAEDADDGLTLVGPKVIWTDFLGEGYPSCIEPLKVQGEWGVFYIPADCEVTIPTINGGGRWISIIDHELINDIWSSTHSNTPGEAMEVAIEHWSDEYSISFEGGGMMTLEEGQVALVWTDWNENPPTLAFSLNADYGYGVFILSGPGEWNILSGGAHVFDLP